MLELRFPGWDPVVQMAEAANDVSLPIETRLQMAEKVAPYLRPKRRAIQVDVDSDRLPVVVMDMRGVDRSSDETPLGGHVT